MVQDTRRSLLILMLTAICVCGGAAQASDPATWPVVFQDDFTDPDSGWWVGEDEYRTHRYVDGGYEIVVHNTAIDSYGWLPGDRDYLDFAIEFEAQIMEGRGQWGLLLWAGNTGYFITLSIYGDCMVRRYGTSPPTRITRAFGFSAASPNRLRLVAHGDTFTAWLNAEPLTTFTDGTARGVRVALVVWKAGGVGYGAGYGVRFEQVVVREDLEVRARAEEAGVLRSEADARYATWEMEEAAGLYQDALELYRELEWRTREGDMLLALGNCYYQLSDYRRAIEHYERSLEIRREVGDRRGEANSLIGLGICYAILGGYPRAIALHEEALEISVDIGDRSGEAASLGNLGHFYVRLGDYVRAIDHVEQSLAIFEEIEDRGGEADSLMGLGSCSVSLGDYPRAIEYYERSLEIRQDIGDRRGEATSLGSLGNCYALLGDYRRAIEYWEQGCAVFEEIGDRAGEAWVLNNLGKIHKLLSDYSRAIDMLGRSLEIFVDTGYRRGEAYSLNNLGSCYRHLSDFLRAVAHHERALAIFDDLGYPFGQANSLNNLGRAHEGFSDYAHAMELYERALALAEEVGAPEMERNAHWGLGRTHRALEQPDRAVFHYEQALSIVETIGARVQLDELSRTFLESVRPLYEEYLELLIELDRYEDTLLVAQRLQALVFLDLLSVRPATARDLDAEEVRVEEIRADTAWVTAHITEDMAVIEYFVASDSVRIWVTTRDGTDTPVTVPVARSDLVERVISFRRELEKGLAPGRPPARLELFAMARELYEVLIEPMLGALEGRQHLVIIPQGPLHYVPFAALYSCPGCEGGEMYHGGSFLVEQFALSYAPSMTTLKHTRSLREERALAEGLLALVDPDGSLPGARGEADAIAAQFCEPTVLLGQEATEEAVRRWAGHMQHILFSTHGVFDPLNPMYSYLVMHPAGEDDGQLRTYEVFKLTLRADLVTISACETLLPGVRDAEESFARLWGEDTTRGVPSHILDGLTLGVELVGLTGAFIQAGAQSVLATHWKVCDEATQELMEDFYGNLLKGGMDKAQALRAAQLHLLSHTDWSGMRIYRHPVYWAAFSLYGDWE